MSVFGRFDTCGRDGVVVALLTGHCITAAVWTWLALRKGRAMC